jgi:iron complex outermembrane receptor protein
LPEVPLFSTTRNLAKQQALGTFPVLPSNGSVGLITVGGVFTGAIAARGDLLQDDNLKNDRATYRGAVEYDVAPDSLAYASVETGFHSGGFGSAIGYLTYQPEYITAYTIGSKNRFFDNTVQLNVEGFIWKYRNQQITHGGLDATGAQTSITQNIGSSTNQGVEADAHWLLPDTTLLSADVQYLDATYNSFTYLAPAGNNAPIPTGCSQTVLPEVGGAPPILGKATVNCSGKQALNSPKWTINFGIQHGFEIGGYQLVAAADTQYRGSRFVGFEYLAAERQVGNWQTNAQLTLLPDSGGWSAQLFGTNLSNERYKVNDVYFGTANVLTTSTSAPRVVGVRLRYDY